MRCGSVCQLPELPTVPVYQLEAGPGGDEHRCLSEQLDKPERVRFPSFCTNRQMPSEDKGGAEHRSADCSHMAKPDMVPGIIGNADRSSNPSSSVQGYADKPREPATPAGNSEQTKASHLEDIRQQHTSAGVSSEASELLLEGWSRGTNVAYQSGWKRWSSWCNGRKINPISAGIQPFLNFITSLFQEGLQYRTINTIRSAVSSTHNPLDGIPIGQHPLVKQLLKGVYNFRHPQPCYTHTWEVSRVLEHIK